MVKYIGIDTDVLISCIKQRPVLWDRTNEDYRSRNATSNAWNDVCLQINPKFENMESKERNNYVHLILKKWRNIRDTWMKARRKAAEDDRLGLSSKSLKPHIYERQLGFLLSVLDVNPPESSFFIEAVNEEDDDDESGQASSFSYHNDFPTSSSTAIDNDVIINDNENDNHSTGSGEVTMKIKKRKRKSDGTIAITPNASHSVNATAAIRKLYVEEDTDRHLSFYRSLIPSLRQLDEEDILEFQAGVIRLLQSTKKKSHSLSSTHVYPTHIYLNSDVEIKQEED